MYIYIYNFLCMIFGFFRFLLVFGLIEKIDGFRDFLKSLNFICYVDRTVTKEGVRFYFVFVFVI